MIDISVAHVREGRTAEGEGRPPGGGAGCEGSFSLAPFQQPFLRVSTHFLTLPSGSWPSRVAAVFLRGVHNGPRVHPLVVGGVCGQGRGIQARFVRDRAHGQASRHGGPVAGVVHHLFVGLEVHFVGLVVVMAVMVLLL